MQTSFFAINDRKRRENKRCSISQLRTLPKNLLHTTVPFIPFLPSIFFSVKPELTILSNFFGPVTFWFMIDIALFAGDIFPRRMFRKNLTLRSSGRGLCGNCFCCIYRGSLRFRGIKDDAVRFFFLLLRRKKSGEEEANESEEKED